MGNCDGPKLSEAIRRGAAMVKPAWETWFSLDKNGDVVGACALGCLGVACPEIMGELDFFERSLHARYPELSDKVAASDESLSDREWSSTASDGTISLQAFIVRLNDGTDMAREDIADLIESMGY